MKTIVNKETTLPVERDGKDSKMKYFDFIRVCVNKNDPQKGFTVEDMKKRFDIIDLLEDDKAELDVEDAVFENIKKYVKEMDGSWGTINKTIIEFVDYINSL